MKNGGTKIWKIMIEAVAQLKGDAEYCAHDSGFVFNDQSLEVRINRDEGGQMHHRVSIELKTGDFLVGHRNDCS